MAAMSLKKATRRFRKKLSKLLGFETTNPSPAKSHGPILVSFPKSGRTWLRVMLEKLGIEIDYSHADSGHQKAIEVDQIATRPDHYAGRKVILLIRDPRDVAVSGYFQATKRKSVYSGDIHEFIRDPRHGIEKIVGFNDVWLDAAVRNPDFLVVRYEDLHSDAPIQLRRIADFLLAKGLSEQDILSSVEYAEFEKMRRREQSGELVQQYGAALTAGSTDDPESFKTRRGKVGGYTEYLDQRDLDYCEKVMRAFGSDYL